MKKIFRLLFFFTVVNCKATDVTIAWDASPDPVIAYRIYQTVGITNTSWNLIAIVPSTQSTLVVTNLGPGFYRWHGRAVNIQEVESKPSPEITYDLWEPRPPTMKSVTIRIAWNSTTNKIPTLATLQESSTLATWKSLYSWRPPNTEAFYRVKLQ